VWREDLCLGFRIARVERGVRVVRELLRSKRRLVGAVVLCVVLVAGLGMLWHGGHFAEAAVLYPHPGLVGWWRFDEGNGSVAKDSSGFGNDGTVYGATWVDGKYGKALSFDGTDDYVEVSDSASLDIVVGTWEAWVYPKAWETEQVNNYVIDKFHVWGLIVKSTGVDAGKVDGFAVIGGKGYEALTTDKISLNAWSHLAVSYDGETVRVYINGVEKAANANPSGNLANGGTLYIGQYPAAGYQFNGTIDEARIYNRVLSAAEILETFEKGPDFSSTLLAKVPKGTTQFIVTLSWQGLGSINITIESPSKNYTEDMVPVYQKTVYSSSSGDMLNIKRLAVSVSALSSDENWYVVLKFENTEDYTITVEVQR
jgi:hypothetical protein